MILPEDFFFKNITDIWKMQNTNTNFILNIAEVQDPLYSSNLGKQLKKKTNKKKTKPLESLESNLKLGTRSKMTWSNKASSISLYLIVNAG